MILFWQMVDASERDAVLNELKRNPVNNVKEFGALIIHDWFHITTTEALFVKLTLFFWNTTRDASIATERILLGPAVTSVLQIYRVK